MKKVAFHTLGCKLNFAETSAIKRQFSDYNYELVGFNDWADIYVINTCSVTLDANRDCRKTVRKALRTNPEAFVAVIGCYAQLEPEEIAEIEGVDLILGAENKFDLFELAGQIEKKDDTVIHHSDVNRAVDFHHSFSSNDRTRAFLKVQDGCDYKCAFCTIPLARGKSRSPQIEEVVQQAKKVVSDGYKEIVLTGVNIGDFGKINGSRKHEQTFLELLKELDQLNGLHRIRISSIEPNLLNEDIIRFVAASRCVQPHFHMPLQSGSDEMLKLMRRRYRTGLYRDRVELIHSVIPDACIGVDVITGHPGETEALFNESFDFINQLPASYLHVFTYSERPNTPAAEMDSVVPVEERRRRTHQLRRLSDKKRFDFDTAFQGQTRPVLFEDYEKDGFILGWTDNYIRTALPYSERLANSIIPCTLADRTTAGYFEAEPETDIYSNSSHETSFEYA